VKTDCRERGLRYKRPHAAAGDLHRWYAAL